MEDLGVTASVSMSTENVERAFDRVGDKAAQMANKVAKEAEKAGAATDNMGAGAEKSAEKFTRAESRMRTAIQKSTRELEMLGKTASQKFEAQLEFKGLDKAKFQPFLDELRKAEEATKKAESGLSGLGSAAQAAGRAMAVAFSGAAAFGVVGKLVEVQREFDVLNSSLKTVTGSSAAAERELSWLKTFAKETPFGLAQATQGFVKMKALGLDPTRAALTSFGNTASAMGKDLNQMIEAVADASTGEFERLKEFGIKAKKEGDNVSLTFQGVTTTIKNSASEITKYLEDIGNVQFGGAMAERAKTLDGAISELGDTWDELFRTINERNAGTLIYDSIKLANGAIEDATTIIKAMTAAYDESGQATGAMATIQNGIATVFETVAVLGANLKYVLVGIGNEIGGLAAQVAQAAQFNFAGVRAIREQMVADAEAARREVDATTARILNARRAQEEYARWATRNASAATDPRRIDLGASSAPTVATRAGARATKEALSEYDKLMQRLGVDLPKAAAAAEAAQHGYNKSQEEFIALAGSPVWAGFTNQQRAQVAALFENRIASEQAADAAKTLSKANADAAQARERYLTSLASGVDKIKADTAAQIEATARLGLSKEAIADLDAAKLEMLATDLELQAIKAMDRNLDEQTYNALKQQAEAYRDLAAAKKAGATKEMALDLEKANRDAAKKADDEWQRAAEKINDSLTDALMRGFESGKDFAKNMRDTVANMFKTMVLRPIISAVVNPVAGAITGALGLSGTANAATAGLSSLGSLGTIWNAGSSALSSIGSFLGVGGAAATGLGLTASAGAGLGLASAGGGLGLSLGGTGLGISAGSAGAGAIGGSLGSSLGAGAASSGGAMSALGTAAPYLGAALAIYSIAKSLDDSGTYHTGGAAQYNAATGLRTSLGFRDNEEGLPSYNPNDNIDNQFGTGFGYVERGGQTIDVVSNLARGLGTALDGIAVAFGQKAGYEIATAFADDTSEDGAWGALRISREGQELLNWQDTRTSRWAPKEFGDGEAGYKEYLAAVAKDTRQVLLDMDLPSWADKMLTSIGESASMEQLTGVLTQIGVVQSAFVSLGKSMEMFAGLTDEMQSGLLTAAGSIDALTSNAGAFYQGFFSEAERVDALTAQLNSALSNFDLSIDPAMGEAAKAQFRAAVEWAFAAGNAEMASGLLALSSSFATAADYYEQAADTQVNAAKQAAKAIEDLFNSALSRVSSNRFELENQLLTQVGQGDLVQQRIDQRDLAELTNGLPEDQAAKVREQFEANIKLRDQYEANQLAADNLAAAMGQLKEQQDAATQAQKDMLQSTVTSAKKAVDDLRSIFDFVGDAIKELRGDVVSTAGMQAEQARAFIQRASVLMRSGTVVDSGQLQAAIRTASGSVQTGAYASQFEADNARLVLANELAGLQDGTAGQLTVAEKHLSVAEQQLNALNVIAASINSLASAQAVTAGPPRDQWATVSGQQVYASSGGAVGLNNGSDIDIYGKDGSRFTGSEAIAFVRNQIAANDEASVYAEATKTGISAKALDELMGWAAGTSNDWAKANGLPQFAIGTNYVPRDMVAQIHEGEAIVPKAFNPWANGMTSSNPETERLLQQLVADNRVQAGEIVRLNTRIAKLMERWDGEGLPQARSEAAV